MKIIICVLACLLLSCRGVAPPVDKDAIAHEFGHQYVPIAQELRSNLQAIVDGGSNPGRQSAIKKILTDNDIEYETEIVDWWMPLQDNIIVNFKGTSDKIIYLVAHSDKIDAGPHGNLPGQLSSGFTDNFTSPLYMSDGAIDNGVGCATLLQIIKHLKALDGQHFHSYRVVFFGGEECGLKGSRCHVARLWSDEWDRIDLVINLDGSGASRKHWVIYSEDSMSDKINKLIAERTDQLDHVVYLERGWLFPLMTSDHASFHGTSIVEDMMFGCFVHAYGGILPSRSWFTTIKTSKPTIFLASNTPTDDFWFVLLANLLLLPISEIHGFRDDASKIEAAGQVESYILLRNYITLLDSETEFSD